jgi:hypothetical protein
MSAFPASHPGRLFAAAATLVTAPRLVLAFLVGDGIVVPDGIRIVLLSTSSVATAVAMTGGAAYLAHAITVARRGRRLLTALWAAILACSSALMAPLIAAGLPRSTLAAILPSAAHQWTWAVCAVLAVDLVAAGAIRADAEQRHDREGLDQAHRREIVELLEQRDSARAALSALTSLGSATERAASGAPALRCGCGYVAASQQALAGHQRWCPAARSARSRSAPGAAPGAAPGPTSASLNAAPDSGEAMAPVSLI